MRPGLRHGRPHGRDGQAPGRDRRRRRLGYRFQARPGHGRPAAARFRHAGQRTFRRRAPPRGPVQAAARGSRPAAARRAHEPPGRRVDPVARALPAQLPGRGACRHTRSLLPGQRCRVDLRGRPRPPLSLQGQLLHVSGDQGRPYRGTGQPRRQARQAHGGRARVGAQLAQGPSGQEQGPSGPLRGDGG